MDSQFYSGPKERRNQLLNLFDRIKKISDECEPLYERYAENENEIVKLKGKSFDFVNYFLAAWLILLIGIFCAVNNLLVIGVFLIIGSVGLFAFYLIKVLINRENGTQRRRRERMELLQSEQKTVLVQIDAIYGNSEIVGLYPQKYLFSDAVDFCRSLVEDMRADSIKEAINLYEEEMYRDRIEKSQRNAVETLKNIERETTKARTAAQFAAVASGITAYNTRKLRKK